MRKLIIDRMDGKFAICEGGEERMFAIPLEELPKEAKVGSALIIDDEGVITVADNDLKEKNAQLQNKLFS